MARRIELKGKARSCVAAVVLLIATWTILGRPFFDFNLGVFSQGYQVALFRGEQFAMQGLYWQEHDRTLGTIVSTGSETLAVGLDADIERGTLVILAWRWPGSCSTSPYSTARATATTWRTVCGFRSPVPAYTSSRPAVSACAETLRSSGGSTPPTNQVPARS